MSLGATTLTVPVNAVNKVLKRVKQDEYHTQYMLRETLEKWIVNVRHSKETPAKNGPAYDRHNVEFIHTVFATATTPERNDITYVVIRNEESDDYTKVGYDITAVADLLKVAGNIPDLLGWVG